MKKLILAFCLILLVELVFGQDIQYSQYYSAPLYLNPALTGAGDCYRVGGIARSQWSGLSKPYNTVSFYADLNHEDLNSGFGILATQDKAGTSSFSTSDIGLSYRYIVGLNKKTFLRMGLQGMYTQKSINYSDVHFEDQYAGTTFSGASTIDPVSQHLNYSYFDFNGGMILHGSEKYWVGVAAHHLNRPTDAFYLDQDRLPIKYSVWSYYLKWYKKVKGKKLKLVLSMESGRKIYDKEFKMMIVELITSGQNVAKVANEYGLNDNMIRRWRKEMTSTERPCFTGNGNSAQTPEEKEISRLKKELKEVQLERDILKKAVGIFSKSDKTSIVL